MSDNKVSKVINKILLLGDIPVEKNKFLQKNAEICFIEEFLSTFALYYINNALNLYNNKKIKKQRDKSGKIRFEVIKTHNYKGNYGFSFIYDKENCLSYENMRYWNFQIKEEFLTYLPIKKKNEIFEDKEIAKECIIENSKISAREGIKKNETFHSYFNNSDKIYSNLKGKQGKIILRIIKYNIR